MPKKTIAVIGGKLQGMEAAYLARKAGWHTILIDRNIDVPARGLCDRFVQAEVLDRGLWTGLSQTAECIIPALENEQTLAGLQELSSDLDIPIAFDFRAYATTSSKRASNRLFAALNLPCPTHWPESDFPVLAKPVSASGSAGITIFHSLDELKRRFPEKTDEQWILQEYVPGPSYSLEVLGLRGKFLTLAVTDLEMDEHHDCCRVSAPSRLDPQLTGAFRAICEQIAAALDLTGIMDVEVIAAPSGLKLLEIDARLPSQTPTAVYWSTGVNILELLMGIYCSDTLRVPEPEAAQGVVYEHVLVTPEGIETQGEHIMSRAEPMHLVQDFFGADEAITTFARGKDTWVATLICSGRDLQAARMKRDTALENIQLKIEN